MKKFWMYLTLLILTLSLLPSMTAVATLEPFSPDLTASESELIEEISSLRESKGLPRYEQNQYFTKGLEHG